MFGVFDRLDLLAAVTGFILGVASSRFYLRDTSSTAFRTGASAATAALFLASTALTTGSHCGFGCVVDDSNARPVYLSYDALRSAVAVKAARPLEDIKRVYVYQSAIFLNRRNEGLHVLDNTDPANPVNVAFIEIPGNTEVSIRGNFLYADSYIDLVTLDISDPQNVREVSRQQDIFPYNEYQNVPIDVYFDYDAVDPARGVVVDYVRK